MSYRTIVITNSYNVALFLKSATKSEKVLQKVLHLKSCIYKGLLVLKRRFVAVVALLFKSIIRENIKNPYSFYTPCSFYILYRLEKKCYKCYILT